MLLSWAIVAACVLIGLIFWWRATGGAKIDLTNSTASHEAVSDDGSAPAQPSASTPLDVPPGDTILLGTKGLSVEVKNFYRDAAGLGEGGTIFLVQNSDYSISYSPAGNEFTVMVTGLPADSARAKAEADFLNRLGIAEQQACRLAATVIIPMHDGVPGQSGPFSFCSGGVQ